MSRTRKQKRKGGVKYTASNLKLLEEARNRLKGIKSASQKMKKTIKVRYVPKIRVRKTLRTIKKEAIIEKFKRVRKFLKEFVKQFEEAYESNDEYRRDNYSIAIGVLIESLKGSIEKYSTILDEDLIEDADAVDISDPDNMIEFVEKFVDEMKNIIETVEEHKYNNANKIYYNEFMYDVYSEVKQLVKNYKDQLDKSKNMMVQPVVNNVNIKYSNNYNNKRNHNNNNSNINNSNNIKMNTKNISGELLAMLSELSL
jgi:hypothetical protein